MSISQSDLSTVTPGRVIFLSYRSMDDDPPPENPKGKYVEALWAQLRWELNRLGVPKAILWRDRNAIEPGDKWTKVIGDELNKADLFVALLSRNYIESEWCSLELNTMASRVAAFSPDCRERRIFRADKNRVPESRIPPALQEIQAVRFYDEDKNDPDREYEYFYRGQIAKDKYFDAVRSLAESIHRRLMELGVPMQPKFQITNVVPIKSNGRTVFVAKPALDMACHYIALTNELTKIGYEVVPKVEDELPDAGEEAQQAISNDIGNSELSIHLIGERTGWRPDGLSADIVPFQLSAAAAEIKLRKNFSRIIWIPKLLTSNAKPPSSGDIRDPFEVLSRSGSHVESDQVDSDLPAKFIEFVIQRLAKNDPIPDESKQPSNSRTVYVHCSADDREFAVVFSRELRRQGFAPIVRPAVSSEPTDGEIPAANPIVALAGRFVLCWAKASQPAHM